MNRCASVNGLARLSDVTSSDPSIGMALIYHASKRNPFGWANSNANMDAEFLAHICDTYLRICEKRKNPVSIRLN